MKNNLKKINKLFAVSAVILVFIFIFFVKGTGPEENNIGPAENSAISFWFLPEQSSEVKGEIEALIDSAEKSIYIAVYDINDK
ncbi:MAG: hypothetical protein U9Q18_00450, partial [Caldisericota bacterium]|nr:hypothetical protein [Caldisericota bacterium]